MPTDHFAALAQPRRPWLDAEALKEAYHGLSAAHHPDRGGGGSRFEEINAAYAILRDPVARLRHLLELEAPGVSPNGGPLPEALTDSFMRMATLRRALDAFARQKAAATTPLSQALLAGEAAVLRRDAQRELHGLESADAAALAALRVADEAWAEKGAELGTLLAALLQEMSFLAKWSGQLREGLFQLGE